MHSLLLAFLPFVHGQLIVLHNVDLRNSPVATISLPPPSHQDVIHHLSLTLPDEAGKMPQLTANITASDDDSSVAWDMYALSESVTASDQCKPPSPSIVRQKETSRPLDNP